MISHKERKATTTASSTCHDPPTSATQLLDVGHGSLASAEHVFCWGYEADAAGVWLRWKKNYTRNSLPGIICLWIQPFRGSISNFLGESLIGGMARRW